MPPPQARILSAESLPPRHADLEAFLARSRRLADTFDLLQVPECPGAVTRVSALAASAALLRRGIACWPSFTARDRGADTVMADLAAARALGAARGLILSGDRGSSDLRRSTVLGLVRMAAPSGLELGITVAPGAPDLDRELDRCLRRAEAGASFAVTQYLFTADQADQFWEAWLHHPVSAALNCLVATGPIPSLTSLDRIARLGAVKVPAELELRLRAATEFEPAAQEAFLQMVRHLAALPGASGLHIYTLGSLDLVLRAGAEARAHAH